MLVSANIFQPLIDVFQAVIEFFHNSLTVPWGWSIVLLTVAIRAVLLPLTAKQFHSMRKLQTLQPQLKEIQTKYKEDKQRQQQEMMAFYRENNVNPLASCLPLALQLPVFISLFYMLRKNLRTNICPSIQHAFQQHYATAHHVSLAVARAQTTPCGPHAGAGFLFINDLTNTAKGVTLIVLMVLYVGSQVGSQLVMQQPTMDQNMRRMMLLLPLVFVVFVFRFPAGLLLYWITTNLWTLGQGVVIRRWLGPAVPVAATAEAGGTSKGGGGRGGAGASSRPPTPRPSAGADGGQNGAETTEGGNGAAQGGLAGALRGMRKPAEPATVTVDRDRGSKPPPPPRKKKKRSGRRR
jgi:YidC/Oxa1 family membrane protein insertase